MVIAIGILLFVGFSFVLTAIFIKKSVIKKTTNCTKCIDAKIVDIKKEYDRINPDSMRHLRYRNYYQYTYNNDIFNVESKILTSHQKYKKGQTIKLYINPNNPEEFYNKEDNYNILIYIFSIVGIVLFAISLILIVTQSSLRENHNENIYDDNIPNNEIISDENKVVVSETKEFLTSNCLITPSAAVGSVDPAGYVFLDNGKFAYYDKYFYISYTDAIENRLISYIGTWSITDNKLILNVTAEEYAVGGTIIKGPPHTSLSNYTKEVKKVDKIIEYTIHKIINDSNEYRTPHLYLTHNNEESRWYCIGSEEIVNMAKELAERGYKGQYEKIELSKEVETFDFGKLHLDFNGTPTNTGDDYLKYVLNIKYDGKDIDSTFFNDKENYRIWSSNMAANFKIYQLENVYILISYIAKQCFCDEILIFNTDGEVLKTFSTSEFSTADFDVYEKNITIRTSDNSQCMGDDLEKYVTEYKFKIDDSNLIEG